MSSQQTCALRPILQLWVYKCRSQTQKRVLCEVVRARALEVHLSSPHGALKKVCGHTTAGQLPQRCKNRAHLPAEGTAHTADSFPIQEGLDEESNTDLHIGNPMQPFSYLVTKLWTAHRYQNVTVLCPFPLTRVI